MTGESIHHLPANPGRPSSHDIADARVCEMGGTGSPPRLPLTTRQEQLHTEQGLEGRPQGSASNNAGRLLQEKNDENAHRAWHKSHQGDRTCPTQPDTYDDDVDHRERVTSEVNDGAISCHASQQEALPVEEVDIGSESRMPQDDLTQASFPSSDAYDSGHQKRSKSCPANPPGTIYEEEGQLRSWTTAGGSLRTVVLSCQQPTGPVTVLPAAPPGSAYIAVDLGATGMAGAYQVIQCSAPVPGPNGSSGGVQSVVDQSTVNDTSHQTPQAYDVGADRRTAPLSVGAGSVVESSSRRAYDPRNVDNIIPIADALVNNDAATSPQGTKRVSTLVKASLCIFVTVCVATALGLGLTLGTRESISTESQIGIKSVEVVFPQVGPIIFPQRSQSTRGSAKFGSTVSMNGDGTRVVIGSPGVIEEDNDGTMRLHGDVQVFEADGMDEWRLLGSPMLFNATVDADQNNGGGGGRFVARNTLVTAMSRDGNCVAVGLPLYGIPGANRIGRVEVFKYDNTWGLWERMGHSIGGMSAGDLAGASISIAKDDCGIIAIGSPGRYHGWGGVRVFQLIGATWTLLLDRKTHLFNNKAFRLFGGSVSLSEDGKVLAIGASSNTTAVSAIVTVYRFISGSWTERGQIIPGGTDLHNTSWNVQLSSDGTRLVMSNYYTSDDPSLPVGDGVNKDLVVRAYSFDGKSNMWVPLGGNMHANATGAKSGYFISLSDDGSVIGMGDPGRQGVGGQVSGHAHIYKYNGVNWVQIGPNINGEAAGDMFGFFVSVSGDGTRFAIGAPSNRFRGHEHGQVKVYDISEAKRS